jgi:serine phosphatase RsbU (regulator of sigma subunit)
MRKHRDLSADELAGEVLAAVRAFHGGEELADDLAMLVVKFDGERLPAGREQD